MSKRPAPVEAGFTLLEMIVTMTVLAVVAGMAAIFLRVPVDSYVDANRRALITDMADTALRRIARDVRLAVPNSARVSNPGATSVYLEFVPTRDGGRYRAAPDTLSGLTNILDFDTAADASFEILQPAESSGARVRASANDHLVIFNTGQTSTSSCNGANVYEGCNRRIVAANVTTDTLTFTATAKPFPFRSESSSLSPPQPQRFQVAPSTGPVTYACEAIGTSGNDGAGTLKRYTGYGYFTSQPLTGLGSGKLLAQYISACSITYDAAVAASRNGLLLLRLTLTRGGESVTLVHQIHVNNLP